MRWFHVDFYCAHMLSIAAFQLPTLLWTPMTKFDFRHVLKLLPPHITFKCTCISMYLPCHIYTHVSMHIQRDWDQTLGILLFWGGHNWGLN
jgi:hypothetical protein